jgi:hypothetical protein
MSRPSRIALRANGTNERLPPVVSEGRQTARAVDEYLMGASALPR